MKKSNLLQMHRKLFEGLESSFPGDVPVLPRQKEVPITPQNSWQEVNEGSARLITKLMQFMDNVDRDRFIVELLQFEQTQGYTSHRMVITDRAVTLYLMTEGADLPLTDDIAYSMYVDDLYRDVTLGAIVP